LIHTIVTTGLDPVVHVDLPSKRRCRMDCRIKSGNDAIKGETKRDQNLGPQYLVECAEGDVGGGRDEPAA
jgi:hypothetical protein